MQGALVAMLTLFLAGGGVPQQQSIPDAPTPQPNSAPDGSGVDLKSGVVPGRGAAPGAPIPNSTSTPAASSSSSPSATGTEQSTPDQAEAPYTPPVGQGPVAIIHIPVNEVMVPVTVRDKKGLFVPAIDARNFRVFEDGIRQKIVFFSTDPMPLSVAFVVDQSVPADVMHKVNESLSAVTGAFTPSDTVAVFTYNSTPRMVTDFTGAQGNRLPVALQSAKAPGRDMGVMATGGPMDAGIIINNKEIDPNLSPQHGQNPGLMRTPKDYHPLNDAILAAATELAKQPKGRRRVLYIISDGKEQGSKASYKEVVRFLLTNNISLYGTLVGDSAIWGLGYLDKKHIPLLPTMRDNILPKYTLATGGSLDSELSENGIQRSFARITDSVRTQYTLGYLSRAGVMASRFHTIEVRIEGVPNLDITAPDGYYPSVEMNH